MLSPGRTTMKSPAGSEVGGDGCEGTPGGGSDPKGSEPVEEVGISAAPHENSTPRNEKVDTGRQYLLTADPPALRRASPFSQLPTQLAMRQGLVAVARFAREGCVVLCPELVRRTGGKNWKWSSIPVEVPYTPGADNTTATSGVQPGCSATLRLPLFLDQILDLPS